MRLVTAPYLEQTAGWPSTGRHILAQFDDTSVVVYQAYRPAIGHHAATHGRFGGEYSFSRMSWIKPNFLWMMYRSGWGTKPDQEVTLALRLRREGFEELLAQAVASSFGASPFSTQESWRAALQQSDVRLQWDPDHDPAGQPLARRAIQLGLRGRALRRLNDEWLLDVEDISDFVREQRAHIATPERLLTPLERVYPVFNSATAERLGLG
ncbi:DUF4291 domain-containing protein [Deinococcus sp. YIM 134068]|uniref:DUF4291 domain-containing protein n=1 Tax=Deinococcus lichenicola TaxID=3118910 RepID=UPI002F94708F